MIAGNSARRFSHWSRDKCRLLHSIVSAKRIVQRRALPKSGISAFQFGLYFMVYWNRF